MIQITEFIKTEVGYIALSDQIPYQFEILYPKLNANGNIVATLGINYIKNGKRKPVFYATVTLTSSLSKSEVIKDMNAKDNTIPWDEVINGLFLLTISKFLEPPVPITLPYVQENIDRFFLYPLIARNGTLIFAQGGTGKSFLALFIGILIQNGLGSIYNLPDYKGNVLYLDWEADEKETASRATRLARGLSEDILELPKYLRVHTPLKMMLPDLVQIVKEEDIKLVIVDSVIPALGADPKESQEVVEFFLALRRIQNIGASYLLLTHVPKHERNSQSTSTPIGSVFFENFPRLTWELRSVPTEEMISMALFPAKTNVGKVEPLGFGFYFSPEEITVIKIDPTDIAPSENQDNIEKEILQLLEEKETGLQLKEIAKELGRDKNAIYRSLQVLCTKKLVKQSRRGYYELSETVPF